ncbi:MAG: hypothetical protein HEQ23_03645 [Tepidisphaera sp.]
MLTSIAVAAIAALTSTFDYRSNAVEFARFTREGDTWKPRESILSETHRPFPEADRLATSFEARINPAWAERPQRSTVIRKDVTCYAFHGVGLDHIQLQYLDIGDQVSAGMYMVNEVRAGWPMHCLTGISRGLWKSPPEFRGSIGVPPEMRREAALYERFIPIRPLPGLAANTVFYAGLYLFAAFAIKATIRRRRVRRSLCPGCGYQRTGLAPDSPCPECASPSAGTK